MHGFGNDAAVQGNIVNVVLGNHVLHQLVGRLGFECFPESVDSRGIQGAEVGLGGHVSAVLILVFVQTQSRHSRFRGNPGPSCVCYLVCS